MCAIRKWAEIGGCPPWSALSEESLLDAVDWATSALTAQIAVAKKLIDSCSWHVFQTLDRAWANFDAVHRLCHAAYFLDSKKYLDSKAAADKAQLGLWKEWSCSRLLARLAAALSSKPSLRLWQRDVLAKSGLGEGAYERVLSRTRRVARAAAIEKMERACSANIASSIEQTPVWASHREEVKGLPSWLVALGRSRAKAKGWIGWVFYASYREYRIFMARCESRELRQAMYKARSKAGSEYVAGCDNSMHAKGILANRKAEAQECGYASYAQYCLVDHMLVEPEDVEALLLSYAEEATPHALQERHDLELWMRDSGRASRLEPWDYRFARAAIESAASDGVMDACQTYFPPVRTMDRSVAVVAKFLGVDQKRRRDLETADLLVYEVISPRGFSGFVTIVPFARVIDQDMVAFEWTMSLRSLNRPIAPSSMVMLQMEPVGGRLPHFGHGDVVTLFHELGHAFHAVLGEGRCQAESPLGIEADALELHSQLIEMLAWEPEVLRTVGQVGRRHMPMKMAETISALRNFHAGAWTISQVTDALCDIRLHHQFNPRGRLAPWEVMVAIKKEVGLDKPKAYNRQAHQLGAFVGSYVCGDYAYLWSEGMARMVFNKGWGIGLASQSRAEAHVLRSIFFDFGSRLSTTEQIKKYLGELPSPQWLSISRGFK